MNFRFAWRVGGLVFVLAVIALGAGSGSALACLVEGNRPLKIDSFSMEPTRATSYTDPTGSNATIVNEPYASPFTQAGAHPWGLTTVLEFESEPTCQEGRAPTEEPRDVVVGLPPGLLGDPMAVPRCSLTDAFALGACPAATQVGVYRVKWFGGHTTLGPIADVVPEKGQSAEFAFLNSFHVSAGLTGHLVRVHEHGRETYGLTVTSNGIPAGLQLMRIETTFWGVPADPSHDALRGLICKTAQEGGDFGCQTGTGGHPSGVPAVPFLTMDTDCAAGPESVTVRADSWEEPGRFVEASVPWAGVTGCDHLGFDPTVEVRPDTLLADEPVGLDVGVKVPLSEEPETNATPQLRDALVTLPEGVSVSPGVVDGIQACDATGPEGIDITGPESEAPVPNGELQLAAGHCPDASAVGTATATTPLLPEPVEGHIYLARPGCGGTGQAACTEQDVLDGNLYRLYLELGGTGDLAASGVHIKVEGKTEVNPATGQLTTVFEDNPQTPFSELKIHLNGGPRAPLANPAVCGPALTTSDFTPWSAPGVTPEGLLMAGTADATPSSFFTVQGCSVTPAFKPGFLSGTVTPQAGQFSAFTMNLSRADREQYVKGIQLHTPPGLLGMLSSVPLCGAVDAEAGTCPVSSKIGTTRVATGAGSHPFEIEGDVFLTGPYRGSPFGLSIVVHVVAGPFNLGDVVVRAQVAVDPTNSTLTVTTDETGPHAIPQIVFGVPVRLKRVTVNIDRPGFMFNPTNCNAQQITAVLSGNQNATATVSSPFAVGGCKSLAFKPRFAVSTSGHTGRVNGASLDAKVSYPPGAMGSEANISYVKVELPKLLPSRLTTLQKACTAEQFEANPGGCPPASIVGVARATTPLLPVGLAGPVYFVSHGGEAFPSLIVVLQGDGVRVDLTGSTFISKAGVTSSTFKTVPDVPVNTFELYLPEGKFSALTANGNLCAAQGKLKIPTEFVAQNGAVMKQSTKVAVTGCPRVKHAVRSKNRKLKAKRADNAGDRRAR